jgi:hypothetical protein
VRNAGISMKIKKQIAKVVEIQDTKTTTGIRKPLCCIFLLVYSCKNYGKVNLPLHENCDFVSFEKTQAFDKTSSILK